jgi:reductive dehalogenase
LRSIYNPDTHRFRVIIFKVIIIGGVRVSKYHSTLSRREFMKMLGLGGVGVGAAAVAPTVFRDMDELIASPQAAWRRPKWVKQVDKPTVDIDWQVMQRFSEHEVMWYAGLKKAIGDENFKIISQALRSNSIKRILDNKPGDTLRDYSLHNSGYFAPVSFLGPQTAETPEQLGVPRWEGTLEENARTIRAFLRLHGAHQVGFVELDTNTTEKLIFSHDVPSGAAYPDKQGKQLVFADVDKPEETDTQRIIPKKARWVIVYTIRMADELYRRAPSQIAEGPTIVAYQLKNLIQNQLQSFLRTLGYMGLGGCANYNALGTAVGLGVMAGLGETCRIMHLMTPEYGVRQRVFKVITDLPLPPGKPIDFGVMHFCRVCKKCSDICPAKALDVRTDPEWEVYGPYSNPGVRIWRRNEPRCLSYKYQLGQDGCDLCFAVCPLSQGTRKAFYHDIMRATISNTSTFDRFFRNMDDFLGYGRRDDYERFWELDLPPFAWD